MAEAAADDPVSNCMQKIVKDPATMKIFTTIFSGILIHNSVAHSRGDWSAVPLVVIFSACFLYSLITLFIVVFKKQENVGQCRMLKAIFCGRNIFWNEIQTYAAYTLAIVNISGLALINENGGQGIQGTFCAFNLVMFAAEWYVAATKNKTYVNVENPKLTISCWKCFMGLFTKCPIFYNLVRTICLIVALLLLMTYSNFERHTYYYIYCISYAICASITLFILQIFTSNSPCGKKGQTYMMLIITSHVFLAILSLSFVAEYKPVSKTIPKWKNVGVPNDFKNSWKVNENSQNKAFDKNEQLAFPTTISPSLTTWYIGRSSHAEIFHAPSCCPITYGLTCFVLILSILDLYVRAIFSEIQYQNNCEPKHEKAKTVPPFPANEEVKNVDDLKINVAMPQMFDEPNKQHFLV